MSGSVEGRRPPPAAFVYASNGGTIQTAHEPITAPCTDRQTITQPSPHFLLLLNLGKNYQLQNCPLTFHWFGRRFCPYPGVLGGGMGSERAKFSIFSFQSWRTFSCLCPWQQVWKDLERRRGRWILLVKMTKDNVGQIPTWLWPHLNWLANSFHRHHFFSFSSWSIPAPL